MAFPDGLRQLLNFERSNPLNRANLTAICDSAFKSADFDGLRFFPPFSTTVNFGWNDTSFPAFMDAVQFVINTYRRKVWLDLTDVQNKGDVTGAGETTTLAHIVACVAEIAKRNIDPEFLLVGGANEWTDNNDVANPARLERYAAIRAALPNHYQSWAGGYWDYYKTAELPSMLPPPDKLCMAMFHSYESHGDWKGIIAGVKALCDSWGVPGCWAEFGIENNCSNLDTAANMTQLQNNWYNFCAAAGPAGISIAPWAATDGSALRLNVTGGWALRPEVISSANWNRTAYKTPGVAALYGASAAPTTPPATVPVSPVPVPVAPVSAAPSVPAAPVATPVVAPVATPVSTPSSAGSANTPAASGTPLSASAVVTASALQITVTKATGAVNTIRLAYGKTALVLADGAADRTHTYSVALPAPGLYSGTVALDGNAATASVNFIVPDSAAAAPVTPVTPAAPVTAPVTAPAADPGSTDNDILIALTKATAAMLAAVRAALGL